MPSILALSWHRTRARLSPAFEGADWKVCLAFWLFGLINNILYVIILSAALDLVGPGIPKGTVLLADVIPSFFIKLTAPYYIHLVPYNTRVLLFCAVSACGMLLIALSPDAKDAGDIVVKMLGIVMASLSSGAGELSFLGLTHFYGPFSLASWGSGTGGAGLVGAGLYAVATTGLGISVRATLLGSALFPVIMLLSFFVLLPKAPLKTARKKELLQYQSLPTDEDEEHQERESAGLLQGPDSTGTSTAYNVDHAKIQQAWQSFLAKIRRAKSLFWPYMLPLFLVYVAEYTINQGVAPTLLFPLSQSPFKHYRGFYPTYNAIYQVGVFISRSSLPFIRVRRLYTPAVLQVINLIALTAHAAVPYLPSVYFVFAIVFWEGLLGGLVYVSTFAAIREEVPDEDREFSLGATTVSDSGGICVAGFLGMAMEKTLCAWQVRHGRDWCTLE